VPVDLPISAFSSLALEPDLGINSARSEGGLIVTSRRTDPWWSGTITTGDLDPRGDNERADFIAWLTWAVDLNMRVDMVHPRHRYPRSYTAQTWPMIGNAQLVAVPNLRTILVSGLPVGLVLKRSDRLSITQGDIICHRWIAQDVVVGSAISQSLTVTPRLPIGVLVPGAAVVLKDPKLRFMIVAGSWRDSAEAYGPTPVTFSVEEALR
jgi:hypothetical protein